MTRYLRSAGIAAILTIIVSGCTPPGLTDDRLGALWPRSDQRLSVANQTEIEALLRRLGYFRGTVDGAVTAQTRVAIKAYQQAVGAPANGVISATLLNSLRRTAGVRTAPAKAKPVAAKPVAKAKPKPPTTGGGGNGNGGGGAGGGGGGGGGSGGGGGGAWG